MKTEGTKQLNILVFYQYFGTPSGSWSTRMYEFTRRWVKEGHAVTVVTAPYEKSDIEGNGFISRQEIKEVQLIIINSGDSNRLPVFRRALKALLFSFTACRLALTMKYDLVLCSSGPITVGLPGILAKKLRNKKMIFEVRDLWPQGAIEMGLIKNSIIKNLALRFEEMCYRNASLVVTCSPGMEESVKSRFPGTNTLVISNASDTEMFRNTVVNDFSLPNHLLNKKIFIYAGSLGKMDHGRLMISAMNIITDPEIHLVIIGDGAEREDLEQEAKLAGLTNIHFLGLKPKHEVAQWLSHAVACLVLFKNYPVLQSSSPNKLFDAFAAGIPVIHNTTGWMKQLILEIPCGITVAPEASGSLADAMRLLAQNDIVRNEMAKEAYQLGETTYNREMLAHKYSSAMKIVMNEI